MIKALLLDFYGTVVHDANDVIKAVCRKIVDGAPDQRDIREIGAFWQQDYSELYTSSYQAAYRKQRELFFLSIEKTINHFNSQANPHELCELLFQCWVEPPIYPDSKEFLAKCPVPVCMVSNSDTADLERALAFHGLHPHTIVTSEMAKACKPRREIFEYALNSLNLSPQDVLHMGDSITNDVVGARDLGIPVLWVNRENKRDADYAALAIPNLLEALNTPYFSR